MNFVLRTRDGGGFRNEMLGPWYAITHRGNHDFENRFKLMFEEPPKTNDEYFCLVDCERGVIPVFVGNDSYIMSESGQTFEKIYTHSNHLQETGSTREDVENHVLSEVNSMCEQSLHPELFEEWLKIVECLHSVRKNLKQ